MTDLLIIAYWIGVVVVGCRVAVSFTRAMLAEPEFNLWPPIAGLGGIAGGIVVGFLWPLAIAGLVLGWAVHRHMEKPT